MFTNRGHQGEIISSRTKTVAAVGLKHGDLLYLEPLNGAVIFEKPDYLDEASFYSKSVAGSSRSSAGNSSNGSSSTSANVSNIPFPSNNIGEDDVDQLLWKSDGKIKRQRDPKLYVESRLVLSFDIVIEF